MKKSKLGNCTRALLLLTLVLCASSSAWGAELTPLRANYSAIGGAFAPLWLAQDDGLFSKHGLAVDLKYIAPGTATQALLSKSLDIINPGGEIIEAGLSGEKVVYIAGIFNRIVFSVYSKPDIHAFSDLKGRVLGVTQPSSTNDFAARILLQQAGMVPGKDVRIAFLRGIPQIMAGLSQGIIDAGILSAPTTLKARQAGFRELMNITEKNIPMIHAAFASTRDFVKDHPDRVRKFLQGYVEGIKIVRTDPEQAKLIIGKYTRTTNPEDLEETYRAYVNVWEKVPYVSAAGVQTLLNFSPSPNAKTAKPEQFIDDSIVAELDRSAFIDRLYRP